MIFSRTLKEYIKYIRRVLEKLREKDLSMKLSKYEFYKYRIVFLGYIVSENGLVLDPEKIKAIKE
jgi:hypothetical protein